jgi:hypothetical protein
MVFSDSSTKTGLVEMVRRLTNTDSNTYPIADLTADLNTIYSEYVSVMLSSDTRWQWDDSNFSTLPISTTDLVSGQRDYKFNDTFLKVIKVYVKDATGNYYELTQLDPQDSVSNFEAMSMNENNSGNTGQPAWFDLDGDILRLQPSPNYSQTDGIKVFFQRYESVFASTDTTKVPAIPYPFHMGLAYGTAHIFALVHGQPTVDRLKIEDIECRKSLAEFLSKRNKAERPTLTAKFRNPK